MNIEIADNAMSVVTHKELGQISCFSSVSTWILRLQTMQCQLWLIRNWGKLAPVPPYPREERPSHACKVFFLAEHKQDSREDTPHSTDAHYLLEEAKGNGFTTLTHTDTPFWETSLFTCNCPTIPPFAHTNFNLLKQLNNTVYSSHRSLIKAPHQSK